MKHLALNLRRRSERYRRALEGLMIRDEGGSIIPLKFSPSQEIFWSYVAPRLDAHEAIRLIVLKARQVYATTFFEALNFVRLTEQGNSNALVVAHDLDSASYIFGMAKRFYEHLPLPKMKPSRMKEIEIPFPEGSSRFRVVSAGKLGKGRGTNQTCIHASELAYWPQPEVLIGLFQTLPNLPNTIWVTESTANGIVGTGQTFYEEWKAAMDGRSDLEPVFIPWYLMPKYRTSAGLPESEWDDEEKLLVEQFGEFGLDSHSLAWRRMMIGTQLHGQVEMFRQEYPSSPEEAFIASGAPAFEMSAVLGQQKNIREPLYRGVMEQGKFLSTFRGYVQLWQTPQDGHQYIIGVDADEGLKGGLQGHRDYACGQIIDMGTLEQVGIIHGPIQPWEFAHQLAQLGVWYNRALLVVEVQGVGRAVQDYLIRVHSYANLHVWRGRPDSIRAQPAVLYGWETNVQSRPLLVEVGRRAINTGLVIIRDRSTLDEIKHFSRSDTGKYQAEVGHDDRVLALLIALRSREENYAPARRLFLTPEESYSFNVDPRGVRIVTAAEGPFHMRRRVHEDLRKRANKAVKNWMEL